MNETLFKHEEKKWKPRNKQAALIVRRANPMLLHTAPFDESKREPTRAERLESEAKALRLSIENREAENKARLERRAAIRAAEVKPIKVKTNKNMWAARYARKMAKSRGLPPPTTEELRAIRKAAPGYGQTLFKA